MFFCKILIRDLFSWFSCTSLCKGFVQSHSGVEIKYCKDGMVGWLRCALHEKRTTRTDTVMKTFSPALLSMERVYKPQQAGFYSVRIMYKTSVAVISLAYRVDIVNSKVGITSKSVSHQSQDHIKAKTIMSELGPHQAW
jgi:hypothetical protein